MRVNSQVITVLLTKIEAGLCDPADAAIGGDPVNGAVGGGAGDHPDGKYRGGADGAVSVGDPRAGHAERRVYRHVQPGGNGGRHGICRAVDGGASQRGACVHGG